MKPRMPSVIRANAHRSLDLLMNDVERNAHRTGQYEKTKTQSSDLAYFDELLYELHLSIVTAIGPRDTAPTRGKAVRP